MKIMDKMMIFEGYADIYLYGEGALEGSMFAPDENGSYTKFQVGGSDKIILNDLREIEWENCKQFNVPSKIEIVEFFDENNEIDNIEITLFKSNNIPDGNKKMLYFGTIWNSQINCYDFYWDFFRSSSLGETVVAFATLINE